MIIGALLILTACGILKIDCRYSQKNARNKMSKSAKTTVEKIESIFYRYCRDSEVLWNSIFTRLDDDVLRFGYKSIQTIFTCTEGYMRPIIFKKQGKQFEPNLHEGIPVETEHLSLFYKDCRVLEESEYLPEAKKGTACFLKIDINPLEGSIYFRKTNHGSDTCKHEIDLNLEDDDNDPDTGTGRVLVLPRSEMYTFHFKLTTFWEKIIQKAVRTLSAVILAGYDTCGIETKKPDNG